MRRYQLFIDGGTTYTRFTLMDQEEIVVRKEYKVGASDASLPYENGELERMVGQAIVEMQQKYKCRIDEIYASGMITSNIGICEVPYVKAPAGVFDLVEGIKTKQIEAGEEVKTICFVPGISFSEPDGHVTDVMRGEEVEILGGLKQQELTGDVIFVHFGSHNKMIFCRGQKICNSVTTISGELLWTILNETILKSSVTVFDGAADMDENFIQMGYRNARSYGLSRALFMARMLHTQEHADGCQITSYIYGALTYEDITAFSKLLNENVVDKFILYGREGFVRAFKVCMKLYDSSFAGEMAELSFEESEGLSIHGMNLISKQHGSEER